MFLLIRFVILTIVILFVSHFVSGFTVSSSMSAFLFAVILAAINAVVRPFLIMITLPITFFTLGFFLLVINALTLWLASAISFGVHIDSFASAFWGALFIWIVSTFLNKVFLIESSE